MADHETCCAAGWISGLAGFAWPVLIGIIIFCFRDKVGDLIDRIKSIGPSGVGFAPGGQQEGAQDLRRTAAYTPAPQGPSWVSVQLIENMLRDTIRGQQLRGEALESALIRDLAEARLAWVFEATYNRIFGSQLSLLQILVGGAVQVDQAKSIYQAAVAQSPRFYAGFSFDQWLSFLQLSGFCEVRDNQILPTPLVREFFQYLANKSHSLQKFP